eukprot:scaffold254679_cov30-Tisochrysis_lutea.AAC.1
MQSAPSPSSHSSTAALDDDTLTPRRARTRAHTKSHPTRRPGPLAPPSGPPPPDTPTPRQQPASAAHPHSSHAHAWRMRHKLGSQRSCPACLSSICHLVSTK